MQFSPQQRLDLTPLIIQMLDDWGVSDADKIDMLALPDSTRTRAIRGMREGVKPLPEGGAIDERIEHLLGIADALHTSNPLNEQAGAMWMRRRNNRFQDRPPVHAMLEDGLNGIMAVRGHLDCAWDWHVHGSSKV
ncbi:MAG: hypothetical protein PVF52_00355 [Granulosicoccaceae bacterium]|jgi:hypothetical protein